MTKTQFEINDEADLLIRQTLERRTVLDHDPAATDLRHLCVLLAAGTDREDFVRRAADRLLCEVTTWT